MQTARANVWKRWTTAGLAWAAFLGAAACAQAQQSPEQFFDSTGAAPERPANEPPTYNSPLSYLKVGKSGDKVQAQAEAFSAVAIAFAEQAKDFEPPNGVFHPHAPGVDLTVGTLLFRPQRMFLGGLDGFARVGVEPLQALVARVGEPLHGGMHPHLALLEEVEVVPSPLAGAHGQDAPGAAFEQHLGL